MMSEDRSENLETKMMSEDRIGMLSRPNQRDRIIYVLKIQILKNSDSGCHIPLCFIM